MLLRLQELWEKNPVLSIVVGLAILIVTATIKFWLKRAFAPEQTPEHPDTPKALALADPDVGNDAKQQWRDKLARVAKPVETGAAPTSGQVSQAAAAELNGTSTNKADIATRMRDRLNKLKQ